MKQTIAILTALTFIVLSGVSYAQYDWDMPDPDPVPAVSVPFDPAAVLAQEVADLRAEVKELIAKVTGLETAKDRHAKAWLALMKQVSDLENTNVVLANHDAAQQARLAVLEASNADLAHRVGALEADLRQARQFIRNTREEFAQALKSLRQGLEEGMTRLRQELAQPVAQAKEWAEKALTFLGRPPTK